MARSPRDMALSMLALLVPLFLLLAVYRSLGGESATVVDPAPTYDNARAAQAFTVVEPVLRDGWEIASATFRRDGAAPVLRIGLRGPNDGTAQVIETTATNADATITDALGGQRTDAGTVNAGGRNWHGYTAATGRRALVDAQPGGALVLVGDLEDAELRQLAGSLS
jgi:hypothetical protein